MDGTTTAAAAATTTTLKLIIEKGPRAGETLTYPATSLINIGRLVRGNTIAIKDSGISSKHLSIHFDTHLNKWALIDLDSSNGTVLNGLTLKPHLPSLLNHTDRIKIGELTSILVNIEVEALRPRRNIRRQGKCEPQIDDIVETGMLGEKEGKEAAKKRNLRSSANKDVETVSDRRILRGFKKEEALDQILENVDVLVAVEPKKRRGRRKKAVEEVSVDGDLAKGKAENVGGGSVVGRVTRGRRKGLTVEAVENAGSGGFGLEENLNNEKECLQVDWLEKVNESGLGENLDSNNESVLENVVEKVVCERNDVMAGESFIKGKEVVEEAECVKDGCDNGRWLDLEKMTLGDFFDYLEVQLPKEIYDKSEKIISDLAEKARKCHEFRVQRNESGKGN